MNRVLAQALLAAVAGLAAGCEADEACGPDTARVQRVIDGDTLDLEGEGRVRILGIDAPETGDLPECGGEEARAFLETLLAGRTITLEYDVVCRDRFDRLLAHVRLDGVSAGRAMLDAGMACAMFLEPNRAHRDAFLRAAQVARSRGSGLWGACRPLPCE